MIVVGLAFVGLAVVSLATLAITLARSEGDHAHIGGRDAGRRHPRSGHAVPAEPLEAELILDGPRREWRSAAALSPTPGIYRPEVLRRALW